MFTIIYEQSVIEEDFPRIPKKNLAQIVKAIGRRLSAAPMSFGKPLRHGLSGMRSLRVGDYRVGYVVDGENVIIQHIEIRRDAYEDW